MKKIAMHKLLLYFSLLFSVACPPVWSQNLPPASRTVYKCEDQGKTVYSDSPCLGAKKMDVEPTRGLSKLSGRERIGADVLRERTDEVMAEALKPILNESAEQRAVRHRRAKLSPVIQTRCEHLDEAIQHKEEEEATASSEELPALQRSLFKLRKEQHELKC